LQWHFKSWDHLLEIPKDILRWLVWAIKIPIKLAYQAVALNANEHPYDFGLSFVFSNWPEGSTFKHPKDYRGLRIAEVTPGVDQILVVNDYLDTNGIRLRKPRFIPLLNSRRLGLYERDKSQGVIDILDVELQSSDERVMTKLKRLGELPQVDISRPCSSWTGAS